MTRQRAPRQRSRRSFGAIRQLPSGRFQASYLGPDAARHRAPETFAAKTDAEGWLSEERRMIDLGTWSPLEVRQRQAQAETERTGLTVRALCDRWLDNGHLKASTAQGHRKMMNMRVLNTSLADELVVSVTRLRIVEWWAEVQQRWPDTAPTNAYGYKRLKTCFKFAVDNEVIDANPVSIKGAGVPPRPKTRDRNLITVTEAQRLADGMNERLRVPTQLLVWCGLRIGELLELRRKDIHGLTGTGPVTLRIRRTASRLQDPETRKQVMVSFDTPKTEAANRDLAVPETVAVALREHCRKYVGSSPDALIVTTHTGRIMLDTTFRSDMVRGKRAAGREDITPHDCRRFYATTLVSNGVNVEDVRRLMGHETVDQVMEYMRSASGYQQRAAAGLDALLSSAESTPDDQRDREPEK